MAITQVRVKLGEEWTALTYNETTGRWEGQITPPGTSIHQPGGYYSLTAEVTNSTGQTDTLSGAQYAPLRLVVRETAAPTLTLVSPSPGYLQTGAPVFTLDAVDEEGGSGVDPESFSPSPVSTQAIPGGCRFTWSPETAWTDGSHTVTFSVSDYDGNESTVSAAYTVDTAPPVLTLTLPDTRRVVDWEEISVAGYAVDDTSGLAEIQVNGQAVAVTDGSFSAVAPLAVGENNIQITATDNAGQSATETLWVLRLITDRTQADVDAVTALAGRNWESFTQDEKDFWLGVVRGAYNDEDMNRVGVAVDYLARELLRRGYAPVTSPKTDWAEGDGPTPTQRQTYLDNVASIRAQLPVHAPDLPPDMEAFNFGQANDIEKNLVETDRFFPLMDLSPFYSGEVFCGEV